MTAPDLHPTETAEFDQSEGAGDALLGINTSTGSDTNYGAGVYGQTNQIGTSGTTTAGVVGINTNTSGTGVASAGNNTIGSVPEGGAGGAFEGTLIGVYGAASEAGSHSNPSAAVEGFNATNETTDYLNYYNGTQYKVYGTGTVSTVVADPRDPTGEAKVTLHAPETPEIYFEDFGEANLSAGFAHVDLDPILVSSLQVDETHPLRVFIQILDDDDSAGVSVKNRTAHGFDVVERQGGHSNLRFGWQVVANRADEVFKNGLVSHNADMRFEPFTKPAPPRSLRRAEHGSDR